MSERLLIDWTDVPPEDIIWAERPDGERVRYGELRKGDIFRPWLTNRYVTIQCEDQDGSRWYRCVEDGQRSDGLTTPEAYGYQVICVEADYKKALH